MTTASPLGVAGAPERARVTHPTMLAFGERVACVRDPQGHLWWLHERVEEIAPEELASRFADPAAQQAMAYVQRTLREELRTTARIGSNRMSRDPVG